MVSSLRVQHFSTFPGKGGAGIAAARIVNGLLQSGYSAGLTGVEAKRDLGYSGIQYSRSVFERIWRRVRKYQTGQIQNILCSPCSNKFFFCSDLSPHGRAMGAEMLVPDLVHLHWVSDFVDYPATLSMIPRSTPLVWTLHDMGVFTGGCSYSFECRGFEDQCGVCPQQAEIQAATRSSYWRRAKALQTVRDRLVLVSPSEWLASEARQSSLMKNVPCHVIRNGLDLSIFHPDLRLAARQHFQFEGDDVVLLFAAAALETPVKGMSILRGALESMHRDRRFRICFVGAGVPDGYPTDWRWLGETKSDQEIAAIYAAADMLVVPSLAENLPNVICESLACGTPVIGSNVGGIPELVIDGKTGYLFECEDAAGLARRIDQMMIEAKTNRQAWSKRCRDFAEQFLDIDACVQSHLELYDSLLQPPSG